jgi:hypothetical protein
VILERFGALIVLLAPLGLGVGTAHAFRTVPVFSDPARDGGGGARHFTGSVGDGYTCAVCHEGGEARPVTIEGVPLDGYVPGGTYEIEILLPPAADSSSLGLELTDMGGAGVGSLLLPADPGDADLCDDGTPAASRVSLPQNRAVIATNACGAERVRAIWTAPSEPVGAIWFHTVVVTADGSGDARGDGVEAIAMVIPIGGGSAEAARVGSTCSTSNARPSPMGLLAVFLAGAVGVGRRRGRGVTG